ncbi:MAG: hypothetical protein HKM23_07310 [Nitrosopumilus sp.]|nr:hypothetical protein [Nitrosopumilus sp.]NNL58057.1 hypothetical protein [Nitrosopumilus sp.]
MSDRQGSQLSIREIILKGTIIAIIVSVPSILVFFLVWQILDNLMLGAIIGAVVHFMAMGFSLKISKKILVQK